LIQAQPNQQKKEAMVVLLGAAFVFAGVGLGLSAAALWQNELIRREIDRTLNNLHNS
jgi:hypothetical protein